MIARLRFRKLYREVKSISGIDAEDEIVKEEGPDHNKNFYVHALLGERILGEGCGHTKKAAEQQAAYCAIKKLRKQG